MKNLIKVLTALAAVVGAVYAIATYGEEIAAWAKSILNKLPKCPCCKECDIAEEAPAEEAPVEEAPAAEEAPEEAPAAEEPAAAEEAPAAPEVPASEPVAEDNDFAE